jgi:hypothetical protein
MLCPLLELSMRVLFPRSKERSIDPVSVLPFYSEYWMIYKGPGFLAIIWFGSSPTPSEATHRKTEKERQLADGGEEPNHATTREIWSFVNHSIISCRSNTAVSQSFDFQVQDAYCCFPMISDLPVPGRCHLPHWILPQWYRRSSVPASQLLPGTAHNM